MVIYWLRRFFFLAFCILQLACLEGVTVKVDLDKNSLSSGQTIQGTITVQHKPNEKIDLPQTHIGDDPLDVSVVSDEKVANNEQKTVLKFSITPKSTGLQVLPPIALYVNGKKYETISQTFIINGGDASSKSSPSQKNGASQEGDSLKLEAFVDGSSTLYPRQRVVVGYRYFFNKSIQTTEETLPLLEAEGFNKIGDPIVKDYKASGYNIRAIFQELEADKPGTYQFGESIVNGYVYKLDGSGQQVPVQNVKATAPSVTLTVLAFPDINKPASFNGAMGDFKFNVKLLSLPETTVGDKLTLGLEITGKSGLDEVPMPEVCCQPGFSGRFQQSDIPPVGIIKGNTKVYVVDIRPLSDQIKEIPPIEFSSFNPDKHTFTTQRSEPIPISVYPPNTPYNKALQEEAGTVTAPTDTTTPTPSTNVPATPADKSSGSEKVAPIEIAGNVRMNSSDLSDRSFSNWSNLIIIPIILLLLWLQLKIRKVKEAKSVLEEQQSSQHWLNEADASGNDLGRMYHALDRTFICLLKEKGLIASEDISPTDLSQEGASGDVRAFLSSIEERRFAGQKDLSPQEILKDAHKLYDDIKLHVTS